MKKELEVENLVEIDIVDMSNEGIGIGKTNGIVTFVKNTVVGDRVKARIKKKKKNFLIAELDEFIEKSKYRISNDEQCKVSEGCELANISYDGQIYIKEKSIKDKFNRIAGLKNIKINDMVVMENPEGYRNKVVMHISTGGIITRKGGIVEAIGEPKVGFYKKGTNDVVQLEESIICNEVVEQVAKVTKQFMISDNITGYDPKWKKGLMKHVLVRMGFESGEVMVVYVVNGKGIPNSEKLINMLDDSINKLPENNDNVKYSLESVILNVNKNEKNNNNSILTDEYIYLAGKPYINDSIGNANFQISPSAFYQVNHAQCEKLYDIAFKYADISGGEVIADLYCGVGAIGLYFLKNIDFENKDVKVYGIDSEKNAILDANRNAVINYIVNAEYIHGKVEDKLPELVYGTDEKKAKTKKIDIVLLDPPRSGCEKKVLETIVDIKPDKIVYISCDPATLARDIKILCENDYKFIEATPVDMFPQTGHVETVVLIQRVDL